MVYRFMAKRYYQTKLHSAWKSGHFIHDERTRNRPETVTAFLWNPLRPTGVERVMLHIDFFPMYLP